MQATSQIRVAPLHPKRKFSGVDAHRPRGMDTGPADAFNGHRHRRGLNPSYLAPNFRPRFARSAGFNCRGFWLSVFFSYSNDNNKKFRSTKGMADKYETERQAGPPNATAMKRVDLLVALLELCHGAGKPPKRTIGQKRCVQFASQGRALLSALQCPLWGRGCDLIKKQTNANQRSKKKCFSIALGHTLVVLEMH